MDARDFDGTLVLEKLASIGKVDEFFEAIDADDLPQARALMKRANVDPRSIAIVLAKMAQGDAKH
jgi:hypothetical protein